MKLLLATKNLTKYYGSSLVFHGVDLEVYENARIGIVGANGIGKSTLCNCLCGFDNEYTGKVMLYSDCKIAYFKQLYRTYDPKELEMSIFDYVLHTQQDVLDMEQKMYDQMKLVAKDASTKNLELLSKYQTAYENYEGYTLLERVEAVLERLGIKEHGDGFRNIGFDHKLGQLSGGQRKIVELASILIRRDINLLILDEPMTHLDVYAREWLEEYIKGFKGAIIVVSHDREMLTKAVNAIWTIEQHALETYKGNYTKYLADRNNKIKTIKKAWSVYQTTLKKHEKHLAEIKLWVQKSGGESVKRMLVIEKRRIERLKTKEPTNPNIFESNFRFALSTMPIQANLAIRVQNFSFKFESDDPAHPILFKKASLLLKRNEKIALTGLNGVGKTTFFKIILTRYCIDRKIESKVFGIEDFYNKYNEVIGKADIFIGPSIKLGYYDQQHGNLNDKTRIDKFFIELGISDLGTMYSVMKKFEFEKEDASKLIGDLSGGEKCRLQFIRMYMDKPNFLLLDEPVNHLDIEDREVVNNVLKRFLGGLILISHDRYLVKSVTEGECIIKDGEIKKQVSEVVE